MTSKEPPMCLFCKHLKRKLKTKNACKAFPDKIPESIWNNYADHRKPIKGDQGIRFEQDQNMPEFTGYE